MSFSVLVDHYEGTLARHGATAEGMDWPNAEGQARRFKVLTDALRDEAGGRLLDVGCGAGLYVDWLRERGLLGAWQYAGIDLSSAMIDAARARHPDVRFQQRDLLREPLQPGEADAIVMNGVLTEKLTLSHREMWALMCDLLRALWSGSPRVLAFNLTTTHLDWCRPDLFHVPLDDLMAFLRTELSPHVVIRHDYGVREFAVYVRREPCL